MMHGWGMGGFGMGLPLFGLLPLILLGGGIYILYRRRSASNGENRRLPSGRTVAAPQIFRLAKRHGGILTVSDVVSELGIDPGEAEQLLEGLTDGQRVDMQVDDRGIIRYVFRELTNET
jgi:hypothetical protein